VKHQHLFEVNPWISFAESDIAPIAERQHRKIKPLFEGSLHDLLKTAR
jgi:hypothetical protein